jgi:hypothetical protein
MTLCIPIPPEFFETLDPDGVIARMADAADEYRRECVRHYLRCRRDRGEPGTWPSPSAT